MSPKLVLALALLGLSAIACNSSSIEATGPDTTDPCEPVSYRLSDVWAPAFSPDGRQVAFESAFDQEGNLSVGIYVHDLATGAEKKVYDDPFFITDISWSTSKNMMLLELGYSLSLLDLNTGVRRPMNTLNREMTGAVWTWGGDSIYYTRGYVAGYNPPDSIGLFVTSPDGGPGRRLAPAGGGWLYPGEAVDMSPGGEWLTFSQPIATPNQLEPSGAEIWMMRRDGTGLTQLTHLDGMAGNPKWIEDGRAVVFDYYPRECSDGVWPRGHTWIVRPGRGEPERYAVDLGDRRIQFGFPPAIDRAERQVAVPMLNPETGYGALYLMDTRGHRKRLLHPLKLPPPSAGTIRSPRGMPN